MIVRSTFAALLLGGSLFGAVAARADDALPAPAAPRDPAPAVPSPASTPAAVRVASDPSPGWADAGGDPSVTATRAYRMPIDVGPCPPPCVPVCAPVCDDPCQRRRGPIEVRDGFPLEQPFLTLPAGSPDTLGCGRTSIRGQFVWSNSFGWGQTESGENPAERHFLVDGESRTLEVTAMHGFTRDLDAGLRIPLHWRSGGFTDEVIDAFHDALAFLGVTDNKRSDFRTDAFRVEGLLEDGSSFDADQEKGVGLGDLEAIAKWRFANGGRDGWSWALGARVTLPTGTGPFDHAGAAGGLQVLGAKRLAPAFDLFLGAGGVAHGCSKFQGVPYDTLVGHAFVAVEWRFAPRWSLLVETDYATRHVGDVLQYEDARWYLDCGVKVDVARDTILELGFVENLVSQQTTVDFGLHLGLEYRF